MADGPNLPMPLHAPGWCWIILRHRCRIIVWHLHRHGDPHGLGKSRLDRCFALGRPRLESRQKGLGGWPAVRRRVLLRGFTACRLLRCDWCLSLRVGGGSKFCRLIGVGLDGGRAGQRSRDISDECRRTTCREGGDTHRRRRCDQQGRFEDWRHRHGLMPPHSDTPSISTARSGSKKRWNLGFTWAAERAPARGGRCEERRRAKRVSRDVTCRRRWRRAADDIGRAGRPSSWLRPFAECDAKPWRPSAPRTPRPAEPGTAHRAASPGCACRTTR